MVSCCYLRGRYTLGSELNYSKVCGTANYLEEFVLGPKKTSWISPFHVFNGPTNGFILRATPGFYDAFYCVSFSLSLGNWRKAPKTHRFSWRHFLEYPHSWFFSLSLTSPIYLFRFISHSLNVTRTMDHISLSLSLSFSFVLSFLGGSFSPSFSSQSRDVWTNPFHFPILHARKKRVDDFWNWVE